MEDLPFRAVRSNEKDEPLAAANNLLVARAAFQKCAELYPANLIELKHGIRVIDKSTDIGEGDPHEALLANYRALAQSVRLIRDTLEESFRCRGRASGQRAIRDAAAGVRGHCQGDPGRGRPNLSD
jgi:hypothetical protein